MLPLSNRYGFRIPRILYIVLFLYFDDLDTQKSEFAYHFAIKPINALTSKIILGGHRRKEYRIKNLSLLVHQGGKIHSFSGMGTGIFYRYQIPVNIDISSQITF